MSTHISGFRKLIKFTIYFTDYLGVESFDMSLFYFPSDPKGQCCGCIDTFERAIGNVFYCY